MQNVLSSFIPVLNPGKCGSTWLAQALTVRPHLAFRREYDFIHFLTAPPDAQWNATTAEDPEFTAVRDDPDLDPDAKLLELYRLERGRSPGARKLLDKAPSNVHRFADFRHLFTRTPVVVLHRDPRDCYVSNELYHQHQLHRQEIRADIGDPDYLLGASVLRATVTSCRRTLELESTLRDEGFAVLRISYEGMKADFVGTMWSVLRHVAPELKPWTLVRSPFPPKVLPLALHLRRAHRIRPPLFRKGVVGDWRNHLDTPASRRVVKELCGDLLVELGYERDHAW